MNTLKTSLNVFKTYLRDKKQIYITKTLPNLLGTISVCGFPNDDVVGHKILNLGVRTTINVDVNSSTKRIISLIDRLKILSEEARVVLRNKTHINIILISPCNFVVIFKDGRFRFNLDFPGPILDTKKKTRITRKSSYVEILTPLINNID
jgi:hypothetical protein